MTTTSIATAATGVPFLHDMDSCLREAYGDPARFAALVRERFPYMPADLRSARVAQYSDHLRRQRAQAALAAKAARAKRREPLVNDISWLVLIACAIYCVTH